MNLFLFDFKGLYVCVKDGFNWCRARIEDLTIPSISDFNSRCTCYLVDLGKIVVVDIENIQPLYSAYIDFPMIALRATLNEVVPTGDDWSIEQVLFFNELVNEKKFKAITNDIVFIDNEPFLHLNLEVNNINISEMLIKENKARSL